MSQRLVAALVAGVLGVALVAYVGLAKLPYAYYTTGSTVNVLGQNENGASILQVVGHRTYPDDGDLRMTYISVSRASTDTDPGSDGHDAWLTGWMAMQAWFDPDSAVMPYADVHPPGEDAAQTRQEGAQQMNTSQDVAIAVALTQMGYHVKNFPKVAAVQAGTPADGTLQVNDVVTGVDGVKLDEPTAEAKVRALRSKIAATPSGGTVRLAIERQGVAKQVTITPEVLPGEKEPRVGFTPAIGYKFPFQVSININPNIGGPSAGLMFSLAVYDYLTPGSLTGGHVIAGTGEIETNGDVGPIGGIAEKIATAREQGVQLYFVPADNCADALAADNAGSMRLVRATSMKEALGALQTYDADPSAPLPSCQDASSQAAA